MNKNFTFKMLTLRRLCTEIIFLKTFQVNIFQIYVTQRLGYCLMEENMKRFLLRLGTFVFSKEAFLVYASFLLKERNKRMMRMIY